MRKWINMSLRKVRKIQLGLCLLICFVIYFGHCPDYKTGFGGNFGVQTDRVDKSAVGWEHHEKVDKHESQKGSQVKKKKQ